MKNHKRNKSSSRKIQNGGLGTMDDRRYISHLNVLLFELADKIHELSQVINAEIVNRASVGDLMTELIRLTKEYDAIVTQKETFINSLKRS